MLELFDKETLDKEQVARIFEPLRRRPQRPAWTGSDQRVPSTVPPVEIPQWIKDRTAANGQGADEQQSSGAVLTPPGSGGDVHGGTPGVEGGTTPEPPAPGA